jgi:hypothetical protein
MSRVTLKPRGKRFLAVIAALVAAGTWFIVARIVILGVTKHHHYRFVVIWTTAVILSLVATRLTRGAVRTWRAARL